MAYEVLARKWRPATFEDVVGQEHVTRTLSNAIESGRVAHAYLFIGPRGIGKTSLARILAKALNCEKGPTVTPCGVCLMCREIVAGNSLDVMEIDGASNNGVDQVRDLREQLQFAPASGRFKIVIIDEVHMLTSQAFNALLKTLEEPPSHVKFIFATTEGDKVLPTVVSRCQRFDLRRIQTPKIVERLALICEKEGIAADHDALLAVARAAEGGLRDALSSLDQLISFKGDSLSEDDVLSVFGLVSRSSLEGLAEAILKGDMATILKLVAVFETAGKDMRRLMVELMEHFRNLLVYQYVGDEITNLDSTPEQIEALARQSALADAERVMQIADHLGESESRLRFALSVRTLIEMSLMRCARIARAVSLEAVLRQLRRVREAEREGGGEPASQPLPAPPAAPDTNSSEAPKSEGGAQRTKEKDSALGMYKDPTLKLVLEKFDGNVVEVESAP